jgi:uncharacterized membrane-anchored protein
MNTHLKATTTFLTLAAIVAGLYFIPVATVIGFALLFLYGVIYAEIKESEEKLKQENKKQENE